MRARDLGIVVGELPPGPHNAITDVPGVRVGHATIVRGDGQLVVGQGPVRTGVTVVVPHDGRIWEEPLFAGCHRLNGNGELTGLEWIRESGYLTSTIGLTNTHSVGVVRDGLIAAEAEARRDEDPFWRLPVVGETWDGVLSDINGMHVTREHVYEALAGAADGPVAEGNVGSGTGMICHEFKGGVGTASRRAIAGRYTVGVIVQANQGRRRRLSVAGIPVGQAIPFDVVPAPSETDLAGGGSIIVIVATDAPLLPNQCARLAQRAGLGVARVGGVGENFSGDLFLAFATGNRGLPPGDIADATPLTVDVTMIPNTHITALFDAVVEATEEAILNALLQAETMTGRDGITAHRLEPELLRETVARFRPAHG
jgi:D-aminopeptidase